MTSGFVAESRGGGGGEEGKRNFFSPLKSSVPLFLQPLIKIKTRERSWMMRATARRCPSRRSWDPPYGTKPSPTMETLSSWNTWTWRSSCQKTAFPPARSMTTARTPRGCSPLPPLPPPSWTSAVGPPHPFTRASRPRTACRAPSGQVNSQTALRPSVRPCPSGGGGGLKGGAGWGRKHLHQGALSSL